MQFQILTGHTARIHPDDVTESPPRPTNDPLARVDERTVVLGGAAGAWGDTSFALPQLISLSLKDAGIMQVHNLYTFVRVYCVVIQLFLSPLKAAFFVRYIQYHFLRV